MRLSIESPLARWAYWVDRKAGEPIPWSTTLCALFWRTVLLTPLALLFLGLTSPLWLPLYLLGRFIVVPLLRRVPNWAASELVVAADDFVDMLSAAKSKVCPIVELGHPGFPRCE